MAGKGKPGRRPVWPPHVHHHRPSGRDRVRVCGRDYWLGPHGSEQSRREYARVVAELAGPDGGPPAPREAHAWPSLAELCARWAREQMPSLSEKEQGHYRAALAVLLAGGRSSLRADRFGVADLLAARDDMTRAPRRTTFASREEGAAPLPGGWSRTHVNRQVVRVRTVWRWAEERGLAPRGSWGHLRTLRAIPAHDRRVRQTERVRPAYREHLDAVLARLRAPAVRAMLALQWLTGARSGELRRLEAAEVDRSGDVWLYRPRRHKCAWRGQARVVPVGPEAQAVLLPWLARGDGPVFRTRSGRPYTAEAYAQAVQRAARKAGLGWVRPYCFRHGAKQRITREMGLDAARAVLGQASVGTTNGYGDAADLALAVEAARRAG